MQPSKLVPHIHCIGIGGIGISAIARYYLAQGYHVTGTNLGHSPLLDALTTEGIQIVQNGAEVISPNTEKVIYTEAIIDDDTLGLDGVRENHRGEIEAAKKFHSQILSYPEALAEVFHTFPMKIAVAGAHGKSTTSAMIGTLLHDLGAKSTTITGTLLKSFDGKNICIDGDEIMNIEACEYRNAFLHYKPDIAVITNIDPDHLDFFKTAEKYFEAFQKFIQQSKCVVILAEEFQKYKEYSQNKSSPLRKAQGTSFKKEVVSGTPFLKGDTHDSGEGDLFNNNTFIIVHPSYFEVIGNAFNDIQPGVYPYDLPKLLVPGDHIRLDASLTFVVSQLLHLDSKSSQNSLTKYPGSWRRMEIVGETTSGNLVMSDYGHHPTEICVTLRALREKYPDKKIIVFFEPHQYSRTYELREEFATSFRDADMTYISDIYAARDIDARRDMITSRILAEMVAKHSLCEYIGTLEEARIKLKKLDTEKTHTLFVLLGAGNIDELRDIV